MVLLLAPLAQAQFTFSTNNGVLTVTGYTGSSTDVVIPNATNDMPVCSIGDNAFYTNRSLTRVIIPDTVTDIGFSAFGICVALTNADMPDTVTKIADGAFSSCRSLTNLHISSKLTNIPRNAFNQCYGLSSIKIPNGVTNIDFGAFYGCSSLRNLAIPDSVRTIGSQAFQGCTLITNAVIGGGVTSLADHAFSGWTKLVSIYFKGNSPKLGVQVLYVSTGPFAIVYYLPGTTGWSNSFSGFTAKLWNPEVQTDDGSFGIWSGRFGFNVAGTVDIPITIEASIDCSAGNWNALQTCTLTNGSVYFSDPLWTNYPSRFYRIRSP